MYKRISVFGVMMIMAFGFVHAQTLDGAIKNAANEISEKLPGGSTVAVINFKSDSKRLSDYVIDELNGTIVTIGKVKSVERRQLDAIRDELNFNMSGEVSDESAQRIGQTLGAQSIIMGSIEIIGSAYKIRFQAIAAETATIQYAFNENIKNDRVLESLLIGTNLLVDFTGGERLKTAGLNLFYGAGSFFIERDKFGGGVTAVLEGVGTVLFIYALAKYNSEKSAYNASDNSYGGGYGYGGGGGYDPGYGSIVDTLEAYPFYIGIASYVGGVIFGAIRAYMYHKPGSQVAETVFDRMNIGLVSLDNENVGLQIAYKWKF
ncbi:MAG: CsgG/HfaB family protein [Treponema sp.]|nr:CsgG/HfaB family protein [Treponema sp.]